jgi:hypothetical protein
VVERASANKSGWPTGKQSFLAGRDDSRPPLAAIH